VHVYANCHDGRVSTPDEWATLCATYAGRGFKGVKVYPATRPVTSRKDEDEIVAIIGAVRAAVGPEVDVLVDAARLLTPASAVRLADRLAPFRPYWFEEPVAADNLAALAEIRARSPIPIVTGETLFGRAVYREVFARRAVDLVNPDVCSVGGILELVEIAAWAAESLIGVSPHNWNSGTIGLAATLQTAACIRDVAYVEHISAWEERSGELLRRPLEVADGALAIPTGPGLGVELDEAALARYPFQAYTRDWPD
jgi:galactonate dehydratase